MADRRLSQNEVKAYRDKLAKQQGICGLCQAPLFGKGSPDYVLDHCHHTGHLREVLCRNCNGNGEGRILNLVIRCARGGDKAAYLRRLADYWDKYKTPQTKLIHYTHKTDDEKRLKRNKDQRVARAKARMKRS